jgi:hypothetical protein
VEFLNVKVPPNLLCNSDSFSASGVDQVDSFRQTIDLALG